MKENNLNHPRVINLYTKKELVWDQCARDENYFYTIKTKELKSDPEVLLYILLYNDEHVYHVVEDEGLCRYIFRPKFYKLIKSVDEHGFGLFLFESRLEYLYNAALDAYCYEPIFLKNVDKKINEFYDHIDSLFYDIDHLTKEQKDKNFDIACKEFKEVYDKVIDVADIAIDFYELDPEDEKIVYKGIDK